MTKFLIATVMMCAMMAPGDGFKREGAGELRKKKDALEGKTPPPLQARTWTNTNGKALKLDDLRGNVVLLDFWGTWCGPCRAALPHLNDLYAKHKDRGLIVIGIHTSRDAGKMPKLVEELKLAYPIAVDVQDHTSKSYLVDGFPDYHIIDRNGKLRVCDATNAGIDEIVEELLNEKGPLIRGSRKELREKRHRDRPKPASQPAEPKDPVGKERPAPGKHGPKPTDPNGNNTDGR